MKTLKFLTIGFLLMVISCGPEFDRESMQDVKDMYCEDVLTQAELAKQRGDTLTPEENAALEFCNE